MSCYKLKNSVSLVITSVWLAGCSAYAHYQLNTEYGYEQVRPRYIGADHAEVEFYKDIKPIVDNRCVVCHGCYDAPCQLKMESFDGMDRGASKNKVYDGRRLLAAELSRLFVDASSTEQWREKEFYPVLNEREQSEEANLQGGLMYRMLELKKLNPLPDQKLLPASFDLRLHRDQQCPTIEEFNQFEKKYPLWGMPYAMPALSKNEFQLVKQWLVSGAKSNGIEPLNNRSQKFIEKWEVFLNGESYKEKLMSRYIYEHLFTANLYQKIKDNHLQPVEFFNVHRSTTPPGEPVNVVATRRPYDNPGVDRIYYRLVRVKNTLTSKNHMPYGLDRKKLQLWRDLFLNDSYSVASLPSYEPEVAANPFVAFKDIPVVSRYKFMLDEAQYTIMSFIKGPVCRGQVAINVINDHFWVLFTNPDAKQFQFTTEFLAKENEHLRLPSEQLSNVFPMDIWLNYSAEQKKYLQAKREHLDQLFPSNKDISLDLIWNGNGENSNAALTIFRHFDSASVVQGLYGSTPKTAWVIDYPLLERIYYLLVSGFDVYGNIGHQLETRLYMDFLRMEGEYNFLTFLPKVHREREIAYWYRGAESKVNDYINSMRSRDASLGIKYKTSNPKNEFFKRVKEKFGVKVIAQDNINGEKDSVSTSLVELNSLSAIVGASLSYMPEHSILRIGTELDTDKVYSIFINRAHSNVSELFGEDDRKIAKEQTVTVLEGIVGAYPNVFFDIKSSDLSSFTESISVLDSEKAYEKLVDLYGVRRTSERFWAFSDWLHQYYQKTQPIEASLLDYNRIENR